MPRVLIVGAGLTGCNVANYVYIDMDDCIRQALDAVEGDVLPALGSRGAIAP